ncbi:hypothetical protein [Hymenobacter antarcticus]|uniref:Uncharacterized protein n=1 Tax=Hymenobacter antarcticus TaxID=486270 RepID=A0ABP7PI10_9BACT
MTVEEVKKVLKALERKMYGYNYEVHFEVQVLDNCETIDEVCRKLSVKYTDDRFCKVYPKLTNELHLWESISYGFAYRGDDAAGLKLTGEKEELLLIEEKKVELFIQQYLTNTTEIFNYPDESDMPYVFLFWGYSFILFNINGKSLFINGISID